jgi:hypothetical protein
VEGVVDIQIRCQANLAADRYSEYFCRRGADRLIFLGSRSLRLIRDLADSEKLVEAFSFLVWEILHLINPPARYVQLSPREALHLPLDAVLSDPDELIAGSFRQKGVKVVRASYPWRLLFITTEGEIYGCFHTEPCVLYRSRDNGESVVKVFAFDREISAIYVSSVGIIFVCLRGAVYRCGSSGGPFIRVLWLSSEHSYVWFGNGVAESADGTLVLGEYGNISDGNGFRFCAYLYFSGDQGLSWEKSDFLKRQGTNKHVHGVWYSALLDALLLTDGDNRKRIWVGQQATTACRWEWILMNKRQIDTGGYSSMAETPDCLLFGTDYLGGTNWIVRITSDRTISKSMVPDPYRRSPVVAMVKREGDGGAEVWASLHNSISENLKCLLMCSFDGGATWEKLIQYDGTVNHLELISRSRKTSRDLWFSIEFANDYRVYHVC